MNDMQEMGRKCIKDEEEYEEKMGLHERQRPRLRIVEGHEGYGDGQSAGESRQLLEEVLVEGEGIAAHIRKIRLKGRLVRQARR